MRGNFTRQKIAIPGRRASQAAECAVRECLEETGITAEITGFLGVYTSPAISWYIPTARSAGSTGTPSSARQADGTG
ncbi:NUDIX hydrolase [Streptomyces sp. bgisy095]|uniref:NUDIX hydrolase n=1 Tax=unclassified Streptomyces TaxID=2593676 RepID=UPI003D712518